jgi:hypothetical protein
MADKEKAMADSGYWMLDKTKNTKPNIQYPPQ